MNNEISDMILEGSLECSGIDNKSGEMLYSFIKDKDSLNNEDAQSYFFYDQVKEFVINKNKEEEK
jgi:hypothetical protein